MKIFNKKLFFVAVFLALALSLISVSSAYYDGTYSKTYYTTVKTEGHFNGPSYTKYTTYDKSTETYYLSHGGVERVTTYKKVVREEPEPIRYYPRKTVTYYGSTYPKYMYSDYDSSCESYSCWRYKPSYSPHRYMPDNYGYDYYYSPRMRYDGTYNWRY